MTDSEAGVWQHRHKGEIHGVVEWSNPEFVRITLTRPLERGDVGHQVGGAITLVRHLLTPMPDITPHAPAYPLNSEAKTHPMQLEEQNRELAAENARLRAHLESIEHGWSSPLASPERWATEPLPFPRRRNDVYRIQSDYLRSIEISSAGPTPAERDAKRFTLAGDAMDLTYEVMHLRMTVVTARKEIIRLAGENAGLQEYEHLDAVRAEATRLRLNRTIAALWRSRRSMQDALRPYIDDDVREERWGAFCELSDLRCLDCNLRFGERKDYSCASGRNGTDQYPLYGAGHSFERAEVERLAAAAGQLDAVKAEAR